MDIEEFMKFEVEQESGSNCETDIDMDFETDFCCKTETEDDYVNNEEGASVTLNNSGVCNMFSWSSSEEESSDTDLLAEIKDLNTQLLSKENPSECVNKEKFSSTYPQIQVQTNQKTIPVDRQRIDDSTFVYGHDLEDYDFCKPVEFSPIRPQGVHFDEQFEELDLLKYSKPIEIFKLIFTSEIMTEIVKHTNKYALLNLSHKSTYAKADGSWTECTVSELYRLIGIIIYFGLCPLPNVSMYWSQDKFWGAPVITKTMSRDRFKAILAALHVVNPNTKNSNDKLHKLRKFIEYISNRCETIYQPHRYVSVDERIVKSKSRAATMKQYMKDKPVKLGFKLWVLADSITAYTWKFSVYTGKEEEKSGNGVAFDVVQKLTETLRFQGYSVYMDNFYTSPALLRDLYMNGIYGCGTCRENRIDFIRDLESSKEWAKTGKKGDMRWKRDINMLCVQWIDNAVVSMLSTEHSASDYIASRKRIKNGKVWTVQEVKKPKVIEDYNKYMRGVDRSDQLISYYNVLRKCLKWWKTLFYHAIDIAVVNSYIIFKILQEKHPNILEFQRRKQYSHLYFREELVKQLLQEGSSMTEHSDPISIPDKPIPSSPSDNTEFFATHIPEWTTSRKICRVCYIVTHKPLKSHIQCKECEVYLCLMKDRNCFRVYHSKSFDI